MRNVNDKELENVAGGGLMRTENQVPSDGGGLGGLRKSAIEEIEPPGDGGGGSNTGYDVDGRGGTGGYYVPFPD